MLTGGAIAWAVMGAAVAWTALPQVNADARLGVGAASVVGPIAALGAAAAVRSGKARVAGALLLVSVLTPTYFAYVLSLPALLAGIALLAAPQLLEGRDRRELGTS